jgi:hypothetical protein
MATLEQRLAKAEAEAKAAEALVSDPAFVAEEEARKKIAEAEDRKRAAAARKLGQDVARRLDFWREIDGVGEVTAVIPDYGSDYFIVAAAGPVAYRAWNKGLSDAAIGKVMKGRREKVDEDDVRRMYVAEGVLEWSGKILDDRGGDVSSEHGKALHDFLRSEPAICNNLQNAILSLDKATAEERKS